MHKHIFFTLYLAASLSCFGIIIESDSHATLRSHIDSKQKTVVIFDLDNTLVAPANPDKYADAGSDQWFVHQLQTQPFDKVFGKYLKLQEKILLEPTEPCIPELLNELKNDDATVIALTARSPELEQRTVTELRRLDMHFSHIFDQNDITDRPFHYHHGIVFAGNRNKGEVLKEIFDLANLHPDHVIFTDDKLKNITPVEAAVEKDLGLKFTGIRYSRMDERVRNFDPKKAEQEKRKLLSNAS